MYFNHVCVLSQYLHKCTLIVPCFSDVAIIEAPEGARALALKLNIKVQYFSVTRRNKENFKSAFPKTFLVLKKNLVYNKTLPKIAFVNRL